MNKKIAVLNRRILVSIWQVILSKKLLIICFVGITFGVISFIEVATIVFLAFYIFRLQKEVDRFKNVVDAFIVNTNTPKKTADAETTENETKMVKRPSSISMTPTGSKHAQDPTRQNSIGSSKLTKDGSITAGTNKKKKAKGNTPKHEPNKVVSKKKMFVDKKSS